MDFKNIPYILIPEGQVKKIAIDDKIIWERAHIYGVTWNGSNTAAMSRTDDSKNFSSPTTGKGTTKGSSPFDTCYPWKDIKPVTLDGNNLVSIPKFWYKITTNGATLSIQISDKKISGFLTSPMHADRGDGKGERDIAYIGRYKCNTNYKSLSGYAPVNNMTRATARSKIAALGTGYYQQDFASFWTIRLLFLVEFATWDGQSVLQNSTNYGSISDIKTGSTSSMAYHTGISSNGYSIAYRYIEDLWENVLEWIDGIYFSGSNVYCINNPAKFSDTANGTNIGTKTTADGYIKSWRVPSSNTFKWALWPASTNGATVGYINDYYYPQSGAILYTGGSRLAITNHGPFMLYCDFTSTGVSQFITTRLMKLP